MKKIIFPNHPERKSFRLTFPVFVMIAIFIRLVPLWGEAVKRVSEPVKSQAINSQVATLSNGQIILSVTIADKNIVKDSIQIVDGKPYGFNPVLLTTDSDFAVELIWTGWLAPDKANNSQHQITLSKKDFEIVQLQCNNGEKDKRIEITLKSKNSTLSAILLYTLGSRDYFVRRSLRVFDTVFGHHFLHVLHPVKSQLTFTNVPLAGQPKIEIKGEGSDEYTSIENPQQEQDGVHVVKYGDYGQVAAIRSANGSAFFGLEHPASVNQLKAVGKSFLLDCSRPFGKLIDATGITSESVVLAVNPEPYVRKWYWNYIDQIRVAPDNPYTLYNSWYDLRSVEYPRVPEAHWMNQENVHRMVDKVHQNMTVKNGIKVDAFVLDDGWDVYQSDWVLRQPQFPNGLKPIADGLSAHDTKLGIWFGPIGGYSFRMKRIQWMMQNGYEGIDREYEYCAAFLCIGGDKYNSLFRNRIKSMIMDHGVRYFKWDGIIFSCNEPNHGHLTGLYSPVSILDQFGKVCHEARQAAPDVYLNITTGTWLSPWWLSYANQIWMDGSDYAFANVPSVSKRDNAITYRDFVLYDDFKKKDLWFPVSNLMTHGLIKGKLDQVGTTNEPLDKLTDDAVLYVARGVSMYELYISPDILTEGEWSAIAGALHWARDRHPILRRTEMIGGIPTLAQPYGYAHFNGKQGIVAMRNPGVKPQTLHIELSPELGLNRFAASLVVEQVYPYRYIYPQLFAAGATIPVELDGFQTAVFEIYPIEQATLPLVAGTIFSEKVENNNYQLTILGQKTPAKLLNPDVLNGATLNFPQLPQQSPQEVKMVQFSQKVTSKGIEVMLELDVPTNMKGAEIGFLLTNPEGVNAVLPQVHMTINKTTVEARTQEQKERWGWRIVDVKPGHQTILMLIPSIKGTSQWKGSVDIWNFGFLGQQVVSLSIPLTQKPVLRPMPPSPWPQDTLKHSQLLKAIDIK